MKISIILIMTVLVSSIAYAIVISNEKVGGSNQVINITNYTGSSNITINNYMISVNASFLRFRDLQNSSKILLDSATNQIVFNGTSNYIGGNNISIVGNVISVNGSYLPFSANSSYVPYTGAYTNVDLNRKNLTNVDHISVQYPLLNFNGVLYGGCFDYDNCLIELEQSISPTGYEGLYLLDDSGGNAIFQVYNSGYSANRRLNISQANVLQIVAGLPIIMQGASMYFGTTSQTRTMSLIGDKLRIGNDSTYDMPNTDGSSGQVLSTNGLGKANWTTISVNLNGSDLALNNLWVERFSMLKGNTTIGSNNGSKISNIFLYGAYVNSTAPIKINVSSNEAFKIENSTTQKKTVVVDTVMSKIGLNCIPNSTLDINITNSNYVGAVIKGSINQNTDLLQFRNYSDGLTTRITKDGILYSIPSAYTSSIYTNTNAFAFIEHGVLGYAVPADVDLYGMVVNNYASDISKDSEFAGGIGGLALRAYGGSLGTVSTSVGNNGGIRGILAEANLNGGGNVTNVIGNIGSVKSTGNGIITNGYGFVARSAVLSQGEIINQIAYGIDTLFTVGGLGHTSYNFKGSPPAYANQPNVSYGIYMPLFFGSSAQNWGIYDLGNNWAQTADNAKQYQGAGNDAYTTFDGDSFNIKGNAVTASDKIELQSNVNSTNDLNVYGNFTGNQIYGEMYFHNDSDLNTTIISSADTWYNVSALGGSQGLSNKVLNGISYLGGDTGRLISIIPGRFKADYCISGTTGNSNRYHFALAINNVIQLNTEQHTKATIPGDTRQVCGTGFISMSTGQHLSLMVLNDVTGNNFDFNSVNVNLVRIA